MFEFIFKKEEPENVGINVKVDAVAINKLKEEAAAKLKEQYRENLKTDIRIQLIKKYATSDRIPGMVLHIGFIEDYEVVNGIVDEMIDQLNLMDGFK